MPDRRLPANIHPPGPSTAGATPYHPGRTGHYADMTGEPYPEDVEIHRTLMQNAGWGVIIMTTDGLVRSFNPAAERIFGYRAREVIGQPLTVIIPLRLRSAHEAGLRRYLDSRVPTILGHATRLPGLRRDGRETPVELVIVMVENAHGQHFIGLIKDLGGMSGDAI